MECTKLINIIVPTLGNRVEYISRLFDSLEKQTYKNIKVITVSQGNHIEIGELLSNYKFEYKHVKLKKKGLSYARNKGLEYVENGIVTFSDDDCWYPSSAFERVVNLSYTKISDLVCFQIYDPQAKEYFKVYDKHEVAFLKKRATMKISSIEIFIDLEKVDKADLIFDEQFGLGAKYPSGEENLLISELVKKGYTISYKPEIIVYHRKSKLTGKNTISTKEFASKGPLFRRMFNLPIAVVILSMFFIKKFKRIEKPFASYFQALREAMLYIK